MNTPEERCAICGWPLADERENGCVRGDCSMRPVPEVIVDPERAVAEGYDKEWVKEWVNKHRGVRWPDTEPTYETRLRDEAAMRVLAAIYAHKGADQYPGEAVFLAEQVAAAWLKSRRTRQEC